MSSLLPAIAPLLVLPLLACSGDGFKEPQRLGGKLVSAEVLNRGRQSYQRLCAGCHGARGDGQGPTAASMIPPPRDFTGASFKFTAVPGGRLPVDEDILRTLRHGLKGTHMPAFNLLSDEDAVAVVQYLKTFSPRWRQERPGQPVRIPEDPWSGRRGEAIRRGELIYHVKAQCWSCHPAYLSRSRMQELASQSGKSQAIPFRSQLGKALPVVTRHGKLLPPDFLGDTVRAGQERSEIFRTVAVGVGGTPMPGWGSQLATADLWAVVYYVGELLRLKGTPEAEAVKERAGYQ